MRVVHVSEVSAGGVRRVLSDFAADQVARGFDVHVVGDPNLSTVAGTHHVWLGSRRRPASALTDLVRLHRLLAALSPDVIHLHSFFAGFFGRLPGSVNQRAPVVYQPHSWAFDAARARPTREAIVRFERWAARHTDLVTTNCHDEILEARAHGVAAPAIPLGVPIRLDWFVPVGPGDRKALRNRLAIDERVALVCLGRKVRQKGYDILLREWERHPIPGAAVYLVGGGPTDDLAALAPTQWGRTVHSVGETDDARSWLQAADLMLLPSRYEGQSVVVSEALACGLPVVAFDVNGAQAAICAGGDAAGAVVPRGDARALLAEARRRVSEPFLRESEAIVARLRAERDSCPRLVCDRVVGAYETAISARRSGG